jgi:hypothetical protein
MMGKMCDGAASISTKTLTAVAVIINHLEIEARVFLEKYEAIGTNAKSPMAEVRNLGIGKMKFAIAIVSKDKVVAGSLVFIKFCGRHDFRLICRPDPKPLFYFFVVDIFAALRTALPDFFGRRVHSNFSVG